MTARSQCCFYGRGCKRTAGAIEGEWICGRHWRLVPRRLVRLHLEAKAGYRKLYRRWERPFKTAPASMRVYCAIRAAGRREERRWQTIKAAVDSALLEGAEAIMAARPRTVVPARARADQEAPPRVQRAFEDTFARLKRGSGHG